MLTDLTQRVVPSGTGTVKLKTIENGMPVSAEQYREELEFAVNALGLTQAPQRPLQPRSQAKFERRTREHAELVDASTYAFRVTFAGRETRPGLYRACSAHAAEAAAGARSGLQTQRRAFPPASSTCARGCGWTKSRRSLHAWKADIVTDIPFAGGIAGEGVPRWSRGDGAGRSSPGHLAADGAL